MKNVTKMSLFSLFMVGLMVLGINSTALAAGTASNTLISNTATIDYEVNAAAQPTITSAAATFVVDNMVDLTVDELNGDYIQVLPNANDQVLAFTLTNTGNTTQDFAVTAQDLATGTTDPFGGTDGFDATTAQIFVDTDGNGTYELSDTDTFVDELAPDDSITVFVVADIPPVQASNDIAGYTLIATAHDGGTVGGPIGALTAANATAVDDPNAVDVVFGDAAGATDAVEDGAYSDTGAYKVMAAQLTITKTATVIRDPFNEGTNPKSIPGAYIQYVITVSNAAGAGSSSATLTTITDTLQSETGIDEDLIEGTTGNPENGIGYAFMVDTTGTGRTGTATTRYFTAYTGDGVSHAGGSPGGTVTADMATLLPGPAIDPGYTVGELQPGESVTITFNVIVQ